MVLSTDTVHALAQHPAFEAIQDDASGIVRYVLRKRVAAHQRAMYFVTPAIGPGSKWLWYYAVDPPSRQWQLAVVSLDPNEPEQRLFPGTILNGNPLLIGDGSTAYVPIEDGVYNVSVEGEIEEVFRIPSEWLANRFLYRLVTEITMSADGRYLLMDSAVGNRSLIWTWDLGEKKATLLRSLDKKHHHTIFSPTDPSLFLISQGPGRDPHTGEKIDMDIRMWLMDVEQTRFEPMCADLWFNHNSQACHEWWSPDGKVQWCDYEDGIYEVPVHGEVRIRELVWPRKLIHGQVSPCGRYLCGDYHPYKWSETRPCSVYLFDREQRRELVLSSKLPIPTWIPKRDNRIYHLDPHPSFSANGDYLVHTTTDFGALSVAVVPTGQFMQDSDDLKWSDVE